MTRRVASCRVARHTNTPLRFARLTLTPRALRPLSLVLPRAASLQPQLPSFRRSSHVFHLNFTCGVIRSFYFPPSWIWAFRSNSHVCGFSPPFWLCSLQKHARRHAASVDPTYPASSASDAREWSAVPCHQHSGALKLFSSNISLTKRLKNESMCICSFFERVFETLSVRINDNF